MSKLIVGVNDLATVRPDLVKEWHPTKNGDLKPTEVTYGSGKKVWWLLLYDVPDDYHVEHLRGNHFDFEWEAVISSRKDGIGCPFLSGQSVWKGFNDLATVRPDLVNEWHSIKNGELKPTDVTCSGNKKVWWLCSKGHSYQASIANRNAGKGCPYCSNNKVLQGYNDLTTLRPDLMKEWHPIKNGNSKPTDFTCGSGTKVWWLGKCGHEWQAVIKDRNNGRGCPLCSVSKQTSFPEQVIFYYISKLFSDATTRDKQVLSGVELDVYIPSRSIAIEYDGLLWHENKYDNDVKKNELCEQAGITLIRVREQGLPILPNCSNVKIIIRENNDTDSALVDVLKELFYLLHMECDIDLIRDRVDIYNKYVEYDISHSLATENYALAKEWHPTMNGKLSPYNVRAGSGKKVWWLCSKGHSYQAVIACRNNGGGCPYCSNKKVLKGYNDLATVNPELVKEWHPIKNGDLKPTDVTCGSGKKVWWLGRCGHEWEAVICDRHAGNGCPYCINKKVLQRYNDLSTIRPDLAKEWHPTKNGDLKSTDVTCGSGKKVWWLCSKGHSYQAVIVFRNNGHGCPYCANKKVLKGYNDLATLRPDLAKEWHPTKNGDLKPTDVTNGSNKKVWWLLRYDVPYDYPVEHLRGKHFDFEWEAVISNRNNGNGCPFLSGRAVWKGFNDLVTVNPELAKQDVEYGFVGKFEDLTGKKYGEWTVLQRDYEKQFLMKKHSIYYHCICSCGVQRSVLRDSLINGHSKSCGCLKVKNAKLRIDNLIGKKYGRLQVISRADDIVTSNGKHKVMWNCVCDCGNTKIVHGSALKSGDTSSCGCYRKELFSKKYKGVSRPDIVGKYLTPICEVEKKLYKINPDIKIVGDYNGVSKRCNVECLRCGHVWSPVLQTLFKGHGCPSCAKTSVSYMELFLYESMCVVFGEDAVIHRDRSLIGKELDIYVPNFNFAIEPGSWYWHSKKVSNDLCKFNACKEKNVRLFVIYDSFIDNNKPFDDCYVFNENLGQNNSLDTLKSIVYMILNEIEFTYIYSDEEWDSIANRANCLSRRMDIVEFTNVVNELVSDVKILDTSYNGVHSSVNVLCLKCGLEYKTTASVLLRGHGCRKCGREVVSDMFKYTHFDFISKLKSVSPYIVVDGEYVRSHIKIDVHCLNCGYSWSATPASLLSGKGCSRCFRRRISRRVMNIDTGEVFESVAMAAKSVGKVGTNISACCNGKSKTAGGYHWKYVDE